MKTNTPQKDHPIYDTVTTESFNHFIHDRDSYFTNYLHLFIPHEEKKNKDAWLPVIDSLKNNPNIDKLEIRNLTQPSFDYLITEYGKQLKALNIYSSPTIEDFSLLSTLPNLEFIHIYHNQRVTALWNMENNVALQGIAFNDFTRLKSLDGIQKAPNLIYFDYGDLIDSTSTVDTYSVFAYTKVEELYFSGKSIIDKDLTFLNRMDNLKKFSFPTNHYTTEEAAWIVANFPHLQGYALRSKVEFLNGKEPHVIIVGKRKPYLIINGNEERIKKYDEKFSSLVEYYKGKSYKEAFGE